MKTKINQNQSTTVFEPLTISDFLRKIESKEVHLETSNVFNLEKKQIEYFFHALYYNYPIHLDATNEGENDLSNLKDTAKTNIKNPNREILMLYLCFTCTKKFSANSSKYLKGNSLYFGCYNLENKKTFTFKIISETEAIFGHWIEVKLFIKNIEAKNTQNSDFNEIKQNLYNFIFIDRNIFLKTLYYERNL